MSTPLLTTKLYIPPIQPELEPRPRLVERLQEGLHRKLTLISAPAGFGKTTLLSEWAAQLKRPIAWLSLDEGDNDPVRFLAYLVATLQAVEPQLGGGVPGILQAPGIATASAPPPVESVLTVLINRISAIPDHFALVLDDYHVIEAPAIHDALTFLLDHLPPQMHLVISTRIDPPLPIARLRGRRQLTELRQADLRFSADEAAAFLDKASRLELSASDVRTLVSRTEGWIAGLQMAAVSMRGRDDTTGFVQALTGSNRYIMDFMVEEVLDRQPDSIQTFLLQTSILARLTGPLCDAVTGPSAAGDGPATLENLEQAGLFLMPLDDERCWYRYHRLFADLLRKRLQQAYPDQVAALHRRASEWYRLNDLMDEAIGHALSGQDFEQAADLIEKATDPTLMRSEVATLLSWVDALPRELLPARPLLGVYRALALFMSGRPLGTIESDLQVAADASADRSVSGAVAVARALIASGQGDLYRGAELARRALELLPGDQQFLRSLAVLHLSLISYWANGALGTGIRALEMAAKKSQEAGNVMATVIALSRLAEEFVKQGRLHRARGIYEQALELATEPSENGRQLLPVAGAALVGLGELFREWNDLETASRYVMEGIELCVQWAEMRAILGYATLARVRQAQGDADGATHAIEKAWHLAQQFDAVEIDDAAVAMFEAQILLARAWSQSSAQEPMLKAVRQWAEERGLVTDSTTDLGLTKEQESGDQLSERLRKYEYVTLARLFIAQNQPNKALNLLEPLLPEMEREGRLGMVIEIEILRALALQEQDHVTRALAALERALSLAEPEGYVRLFVDAGPPMARLLYQAAERGIKPEYCGRLLVAFPTSKAALAPHPQTAELVEPLSARELEVLQLISTGATNQEIARSLVITVNTVKKHVTNILGKLSVTSRRQAAARARDLGLLD
jgi:LuxR family maltose regulon positive regulatory protein